MAYQELIKNFERIRDYMRQFYVYGFKSRSEYRGKSTRSYDDERRRIESFLGDYMGFTRTEDGKNLFLSIDSRTAAHNPLYKAWKSKSFTDGDITLHFILFDILNKPEKKLTLREIMDRIEEDYLGCFREPMSYDESTLRKKLKEYREEGGLSGRSKESLCFIPARRRSGRRISRMPWTFFPRECPAGSSVPSCWTEKESITASLGQFAERKGASALL